jgi:hypothetical protein
VIADGHYLGRQFEVAWKLASLHLQGLTTEECLWRPADMGPHVHQLSDGSWCADWPDREGYDIGPPSIAWLTWHVVFWWSMVLDHSFGDGTLSRENVPWPGNGDKVRETIDWLHREWEQRLEQLSEPDLQSRHWTRWPFHDRPYGDVVAWVNIELAKNAAEIGYARFLYAISAQAQEHRARSPRRG